MLGNRSLLRLYLGVQFKVSKATFRKILKCAITMCSLKFDHLTSCHCLLYRVVKNHKLMFSAVHLIRNNTSPILQGNILLLH